MLKNKTDDEPDWDLLKKLFKLEISRQEAAELFQVSRSRISQLQTSGRLHSLPNGKLNFRNAVIEYVDYIANSPGGGRRLGT